VNTDKLLLETLDNLPGFIRPFIDETAAREELEATAASIQPAAVPRLYQIESTSRCNLKCPFCPRTTDLLKNGQRDLNAVMPLDKFEAVLDKMPWLQSLELFHFGEPFMQKDIHEYIRACKTRGIYVVIASNLLPATNEKIDAAFEAGLDFLVMDVDSLDAARYAAARVGGNLEQLRDRVRYILQKPKRPYCVAQTIMLDGKAEYTEDEFVEWTGGLKADEVRYKFLDSFRGEIADKGYLGPNDFCREPFYGFTVHVNGNVVPCDRDWAGENVMGNIFEQTVEEIWNGPKYQEFRRQMKSPDKPAMCRMCDEGRLVNMRSQPMIQVNMFRGNEVHHSA
jgi:radical SAM protein with 4Fe4S-binding SPASM domain